MHPRTRKMCAQFGITIEGCKGLRILDPIGYHDSLKLTENARLVLTDSGGLQEESTYFRTPCLTLRPNTERPITLTIGSNRLTNLDKWSADLDAVLKKGLHFGKVPPMWDGHASERIINAIVEHSP
jgi:UDP-N-acetylglucosamine 2-epimerase (non-hydrolysing)